MNSKKYIQYTTEKDAVFSRAKAIVQSDPLSFILAGEELSSIFSCERVQASPDVKRSKIRSDWTPDRLLMTRIGKALNAALSSAGTELNREMDLCSSDPIAIRVQRARRVVLAILLATDPDANSYIDPSMCELAKLAWKEPEGEVLGRSWVTCEWDKDDLIPGDDVFRFSCPSPRALQLLQTACALIELTAQPLAPKDTASRGPELCSPEVPLKWTMGAVSGHIGRSRSTVHNWMRAASPAIARRTKGQPFTREELIRLADVALQRGDPDSAIALHHLVNRSTTG